MPRGKMSLFLPLRTLRNAFGPFDDCVVFQEASTELVVFSQTAHQIVTIAW
jgi:hypothetical protein